METVVAQAMAIIQHFKEPVKAIKFRSVREEQIDISRPWAYFDGASQDHQ